MKRAPGQRQTIKWYRGTFHNNPTALQGTVYIEFIDREKNLWRTEVVLDNAEFKYLDNNLKILKYQPPRINKKGHHVAHTLRISKGADFTTSMQRALAVKFAGLILKPYQRVYKENGDMMDYRSGNLTTEKQ